MCVEMQATNDLESNPLLRSLQTEFAKQFRWVQQKRGIVCIPHSLTISGIKIDEYFIKMHTFRPSPFLKDHYLTQDENHTICVEDDYILTGDDFPKPSLKVKILADELGYNEKSEKFHMLLIDQPLVGEVQKQVNYDEWMVSTSNEWTLQRSTKFLAHFPECSEALKVLEVQLKRFKSTYIVLPDYLSDAASKLQSIWTTAADAYVSALRKSLSADPVITENIDVAMECCVVGGSHESIWSAVCKKCHADDVALINKCKQLSSISASRLSLPSSLDSCDFTRAIRLLQGLDECVCPREKLVCLKSVLDVLTETVSKHLMPAGDVTTKSSASQNCCLTSDDYISLLVLVIVRHKACHLASNLFYLDTFLLCMKHADSLSYSLVTFKATYKFILSVPAGQLSKQSPLHVSLNAMQLQPSSSDVATDVDRPFSHRCQADRDLDRIEQMFTSATIADNCTSATWQQQQQQHDIPVTSWHSDYQQQRQQRSGVRQNNSELGDFLSSLKNDSLQTSYGKQT